MLDVLQRHARAVGHGMQRVVGHVELDANLVGQAAVKTTKERATTSKVKFGCNFWLYV